MGPTRCTNAVPADIALYISEENSSWAPRMRGTWGGKHSDTRTKPLPLTNGHGRYKTVINTPEPNGHLCALGNGRYCTYHNITVTIFCVITVSLPWGFVTAVSLLKLKPPCGGPVSELKPPPGSRSGLKYPLEFLERFMIVFQGARRRRRAWL